MMRNHRSFQSLTRSTIERDNVRVNRTQEQTMQEFRLERVPAVIKPGTQLMQAVTVAGGANASPRKVTEVKLVLEINVTDCPGTVEFLFPGAKVYMDTVAGLEHAKGEDRTARTKLPEMNVRVWYGEEAEPVFDLAACSVKSRAQLRVDEDGGGKLILRPCGKFTNKQLADMAQLISADVRVSMEPAQMDLADVVIADPQSGKKKRGRGKKADLHVVDGDGGDDPGASALHS